MSERDPAYRMPRPKKGEVLLFRVFLPAARGVVEDTLFPLLSSDEREKANCFRRAEDRTASIATRGTLRRLLGEMTGRPPESLRFRYSETGKPLLDHSRAPVFSVSHSGDWALLSFVPEGESVGVDVERPKVRHTLWSIADRWFSEEERGLLRSAPDEGEAFLRIWTRKEAFVKARGSALFRELSRVCVWPGKVREIDGTDWHFENVPMENGYVASVAASRPIERLDSIDLKEQSAWRS